MTDVPHSDPPERPPPIPGGHGTPTDYTQAQVAALLKRSVDSVQRYIAEGRIPSPKYDAMGRCWWTPEAVLEIRRVGVRAKGTYVVAHSPRRQQLHDSIARRLAAGFQVGSGPPTSPVADEPNGKPQPKKAEPKKPKKAEPKKPKKAEPKKPTKRDRKKPE